jgi:imidazolonepropionase-like amidohydrolase
MKRQIIFLFCILGAMPFRAQIPVPASTTSGSYLIRDAVVHVGNGRVYPKGFVGFRDGKITEVGEGTPKFKYDSLIPAAGKQVYPGFILPENTLGLTEIDAVRASLDFTETGMINPDIRALIGYNPESKIIPTVRTNGVLITQATPRGGLISGTSSVFVLDGWNWEDAVLKADDGIWLNWPQEKVATGWWGEPGEDEVNKKRREDLENLALLLKRASVYGGDFVDLKLSALKGLFSGEKRLYVNVSRAKEIKESVLFFKELGVKQVVVCGGEESHLVGDFLKQEGVPVLLSRLHSLPFRNEDHYDLPYELPVLLQKAGVLFGFSYGGDMEAMGSRNLPFLAGTAVRMGLTPEQALSAITLNTAKILGIDARCGSLEAGKDATLFISAGDALDILTNQVEAAFIRGRRISLGNHQQDLYKRYLDKYGLKP